MVNDEVAWEAVGLEVGREDLGVVEFVPGVVPFGVWLTDGGIVA